MSPSLQAYRASLLYFTNDPAFDEHATQWHSDGLLLVQDGKIQAAGRRLRGWAARSTSGSTSNCGARPLSEARTSA